MRPYESRDDDDGFTEEELAVIQETARIAKLTDDDVRNLGYKESEEYPGYFVNDPRHPGWTVQDRYLMDHPGPNWRTKPQVKTPTPYHQRGMNSMTDTPVWDDMQFGGQDVSDWAPPPKPRPTIVPVKSGDAEKILRTKHDYDLDPDEDITSRVSGLWVCRICRKNFALWPSERALRFDKLGIQFTVIFRAPFACTNCRVFEFRTVQPMGQEGWRPLWQSILLRWDAPGRSKLWKTYQTTRIVGKALYAKLRARTKG